MIPDQSLAVLGIIQGAIEELLRGSEPAFISIGTRVFSAAAIAMISFQGLGTMYGSGDINARMWQFSKLLMTVGFGLMVLRSWDTPLVGLGYSFTGLVSKSSVFLMSILDARAVEDSVRAVDNLWGRFSYPSVTDLGGLALWLGLYAVVLLAKAGSIAVIAYATIAAAVLALIGPLLVWTLLVPSLSFAWWSWCKAFVQYNVTPIVALAWLSIGQNFITKFVDGWPDVITSDLYIIYLTQAAIVLFTFCVGILGAPILTHAIFSGHASGSNNAALVTSAVRLGK